MTRRYFYSSIHELETLFEDRIDDGSVLKALEGELTHRRTERAAKLRHRVSMRLMQLAISSSSLKQQSLEFAGLPINENDRIVPPHADTFMPLQRSGDPSAQEMVTYADPETARLFGFVCDIAFRNRC